MGIPLPPSAAVTPIFQKIPIFFCLLTFLLPLKVKARTLFDLPKAYKEAKFQFFPIPYFETDPTAGQRYGLMPTFLWFDPKDELITIAVTAFTYNPKVVGFGGFGGIFLYPSSEESLELFVGGAQNYEKDYYLQYFNEKSFEGRLHLEGEFEYFQNPFERFFGFGPQTPKSQASNFVSRVIFWKGRGAFEIFPHFFTQIEEKWLQMRLRPQALLDLKDTRTFFNGNAEVGNSNQWLHRLSLIWDDRDDRDFPKRGHYLETYGLFSHEPFQSATFYAGYGVFAKKIFTLQDRWTTVAFFRSEQLFGETIPFYMQHQLGGENDLRAFVERRFTGRGRLLLDLEERIKIKNWNIMKANFTFSIDPFFSVGQVFNRFGDVSFSNLQPVGGIGFRALVPPSVVGRVDVGVGKEGLEVFTTLHYPF